MEAKREGRGDGVSLSAKLSVKLREEAARWHFYLCCADSAWLSLREADEEEWPCGRTNRVHLYLSSSSESRTAESAAPPRAPPPPRRWEITCLRLPDTLSVCSRSTHPLSAARHYPAQPCQHGSMSASLSPTLNTGLHSSSLPVLVTTAIFQTGGKTQRGKEANK